MHKNKAVLFWRNERWNAGWLQIGERLDGMLTVAWIENGVMFAKAVDKVVHIDIDPAILQAAPR